MHETKKKEKRKTKGEPIVRDIQLFKKIKIKNTEEKVDGFFFFGRGGVDRL